MITRCKVCGRPLKNPESIKLGIGPTCLKRIPAIAPVDLALDDYGPGPLPGKFFEVKHMTELWTIKSLDLNRTLNTEHFDTAEETQAWIDETESHAEERHIISIGYRNERDPLMDREGFGIPLLLSRQDLADYVFFGEGRPEFAFWIRQVREDGTETELPYAPRLAWDVFHAAKGIPRVSMKRDGQCGPGNQIPVGESELGMTLAVLDILRDEKNYRARNASKEVRA